MKKISAKFPGKRILVADDYPINLELTKEMLTMMECEVDLAEDGVEAVKLHSKNDYDAIFMDIQMPNLDGYKATNKIRESEDKDKHVTIIAITANALQGDKEKCIDAGMDDYISKPIRGEDLEEVLTKYFNK